MILAALLDVHLCFACRYNPWPRTVEVNKVPAGSSRKQILKAQQQIQSVKKNSLNESLSTMSGGPGSPGGYSLGSPDRYTTTRFRCD